MLAAIGGAAALIAAVLPRAWRRERERTAQLLAVVFFLPVLTAAVTAALVEGPDRWKAIAVLVVGLGIEAPLALVLYREWRLPEQVPGWLITKFARENLFEDDGVEWATQPVGVDVAKGAALRIYLQNNIDAEREVSLTLRDEAGWLCRSGTILFPPIDRVRLSPRAHAVVTVPLFAATARAFKGVRIYVLIDVRGEPGARNRRRIAGAGPRPIAKWIAVLGIFAGTIVWRRGGLFVAVSSSGCAQPGVVREAVRVEVVSAGLPRPLPMVV
jgi:hypothetical protein